MVSYATLTVGICILKGIPWANPEDGAPSPWKSQVAIGFLRNSGTDTHREAGPIASRGRSVYRSVKYVDEQKKLVRTKTESELPRPIPRNSVESDHGCTSRIYFDNASDNVTLTLYNVTLTSWKPC